MWCLTLQTEAGYLLLYGLHVTKQLALPSLKSNTWGVHDGSQCLHAVDVYVKHTVRCERAVPATCMCCDSRAILVAYADGFWGSCSWSGKVCVCVCVCAKQDCWLVGWRRRMLISSGQGLVSACSTAC